MLGFFFFRKVWNFTSDGIIMRNFSYSCHLLLPYIVFHHFWYSYYGSINKSLLISISLLGCIYSLTQSFQFFFFSANKFLITNITNWFLLFLFPNILPYTSKNIYICFLNICFLCSISSVLSSIRYSIYYLPEYLYTSEVGRNFTMSSLSFTWDYQFPFVTTIFQD